MSKRDVEIALTRPDSELPGQLAMTAALNRRSPWTTLRASGGLGLFGVASVSPPPPGARPTFLASRWTT
ncbi:hypothetical protein AB0942_17280 [Streptomyces nodosus]|uniref:hypothetical protein n=1 Tax=Streptomyces nodosus TaxID=40318 RepID=UPI0034549C36